MLVHFSSLKEDLLGMMKVCIELSDPMQWLERERERKRERERERERELVAYMSLLSNVNITADHSHHLFLA